MSAEPAVVFEPRRSEILRLVWRSERTAGEVAREMPITFGAVSQHLRVLREAGLVHVRRDGQRRWYSARRERLGPLAVALEAMWGASVDRLKDLAEREERRAGHTQGRSTGHNGKGGDRRR